MLLSIEAISPLDAVHDIAVWKHVASYLESVVAAAARPGIRSSSLKEVFERCGRGNSVEAAESSAKAWWSEARDANKWHAQSVRRASIYASQLETWLPMGGEVLDIGSGNGLISDALASRLQCKVTLCDQLNYLTRRVPRFALVDVDLPFRSKSFDVSMLVTVLHHTTKAERLVREALRTARTRVVIKESVFGIHRAVSAMDNDATREFITWPVDRQMAYTRFIDWFYNRVLESDISVPFCFRSDSAWRTLLSRLAHLEKVIHLGIDDDLGALYHVLYVLAPSD